MESCIFRYRILVMKKSFAALMYGQWSGLLDWLAVYASVCMLESICPAARAIAVEHSRDYQILLTFDFYQMQCSDRIWPNENAT
jgi:hypothetical protein